MPIHQAVCKSCRSVYDFVFISQTSAAEWKEQLANGEYRCGEEDCKEEVLIRQMELPNVYSHAGGYPFTTPIHLLPLKWDVNKQRMLPQQVYITDRAHHMKVLKENGMIEVESKGDRLTMYEDPVDNGERHMDNEVEEDMKMYNFFKTNHKARKNAIRRAVKRRERAHSNGL